MSDQPSSPPPSAIWPRVVAVYVGLTLLYAWPLLGVMSSALPHDTGDPRLNTWILWWNAQAWPLTDHWWNAPIFHPASGAFALSETFLSVAPLSTPLQWIGLSAVTKLAPARILGVMMGGWFLSNAFGNKLAGTAAGFVSSMPLQSLFGVVAAVLGIAALVMFVVVKPIKRLMGEK